MIGKTIKKTIFSVLFLFYWPMAVFADGTFDKLFSEGKYKDALDYADEKIAITDRDAKTWVKIAKANIQTGMNEKALACFLVSWRLNPQDYESLLGCATVYNNLKQPEEAINMAKKALEVNFAAEASWEYAKACIALNRSTEAKTALEKVIQSDPANSIANKELGTIYYNDKSYTKALPLLKKTYSSKSDEALAFKIGKCFHEAGSLDSALSYLKYAVNKNDKGEYHAELGRVYFDKKDYSNSLNSFSKAFLNELSMKDLYCYAVSKESQQGLSDAIDLYKLVVNNKDKNSTVEVLRSYEKIARNEISNKRYESALNNLSVISENDSKATIVTDLYLLVADVYSANNDLKRAISSLENAITLNKRNVEAYAKLAELYERSGLTDKAKQTFETMIALSPNDPEIYLNLGKYNLKAKKYSDALTMYDKSNSIKSSADALEGKAISEFYLNRYPQAKSSAIRAIKLNSQLIEVREVLSKILISENDYKGAIDNLEIVIQKINCIECLKMLSECYIKTKNSQKLSDIDYKIIAVDKNNYDSRLRLARKAEEKKDVKEALKFYKELLSIKDEDTELLFKLYELSVADSDMISAMIYIKKYLSLNPDSEIAHGALGDLYYDEKKNDDALNEYRIAMKLNPAVKGIQKRYAEIVIAKGLQDEVINALNSLIQTGDADVGTFTTMGMIYEKKKMSTKAIEMYKSALQKEPSNVEALSALAACQASIGDVNNAIISYEQVIMMNNKAVNEYKFLGELYLRSFKTDEAIKAFKQFLAKDSTDAEILKTVGEYAYKNNDYKEAARYLGLLGENTSEDNLFQYAECCKMINEDVKIIGALEKLLQRKLKKASQIKAYTMLIDSYEKSGRTNDAIKMINQLLPITGAKDRDILYKKAYLIERENKVSAINIYEDNCKKFPDDYRNFLRLGVLFSENKETFSKSISALKRVTEIASSIPVVWLELGKVYLKMENDAEALSSFRMYAEKEPQDMEANRQLGMLLLKMGKINEAVVYLEIANTITPNDPMIMANLAKSYLQNGRTSDAMDLLVKVKNMAKDNNEVRLELYEIYSRSGQKEKAFSEIKMLAEQTNDKRYILLYAKCLVENGNIKEAQDAVENILAVDAENVEALMVKAMALRVEKKYEEAIDVYKEIAYIKPENASSFFERAQTHLLQNKIQWAETFYKRALEIDAKFALAELGLAKIAKLRKNSAGYQKHLENAFKMDPGNILIKEEMSHEER